MVDSQQDRAPDCVMGREGGRGDVILLLLVSSLIGCHRHSVQCHVLLRIVTWSNMTIIIFLTIRIRVGVNIEQPQLKRVNTIYRTLYIVWALPIALQWRCIASSIWSAHWYLYLRTTTITLEVRLQATSQIYFHISTLGKMLTANGRLTWIFIS